MIGGITVLTNLNPWVVGLHFLASMAVIAAAYALWRRIGDAGRPDRGRGARDRCARWPGSPPASPSRCWSSAPGSPAAARTPATTAPPATGSTRRRSRRCTPTVVFLLIGLSVALFFALRARRRAAGRPGPRPGPGRRGAGPGPDRLRAVLHPPAGRPGRRAHARLLPGAAGRPGGALVHPGSAGRSPPTRRRRRPCSGCPPPSERTGACRRCPGRPVGSGERCHVTERCSAGRPARRGREVSGGRGGSASPRRGGRGRRRRTRGTATARSAPARPATGVAVRARDQVDPGVEQPLGAAGHRPPGPARPPPAARRRAAAGGDLLRPGTARRRRGPGRSSIGPLRIAWLNVSPSGPARKSSAVSPSVSTARQVRLDHDHPAGRGEPADVGGGQVPVLRVGQVVPAGVQAAGADRRLDTYSPVVGGRRQLSPGATTRSARSAPRRRPAREVALVGVPARPRRPGWPARHGRPPRPRTRPGGAVVPGRAEHDQVVAGPVDGGVVPDRRPRRRRRGPASGASTSRSSGSRSGSSAQVTRATRGSPGSTGEYVRCTFSGLLSASQRAPGHRPPEVVARPHLVHQFPLPFVLDGDSRLGAGLPGDVGARRRTGRPTRRPARPARCARPACRRTR